jgi:5-methylcytosine-specific restriction endonuclease McrA
LENNNPDKVKISKSKCYQKHQEENREYSRIYRESHPELVIDYNRKYQPIYYLEHKDEKIAAQRIWRNTPIGKASQNATKLKRRAAKMSSMIGDGVDELVKQIKLSPIVICHLCGAILPGNKCHIDHIIPLSKGGQHSRGNIAPACPSCNIKKGAKILLWTCK